MKTENRRKVTIYLEANPNPNALKFVVNYMLLPTGESYDFPTPDSTEHAPLAKALFAFKYIKRVFYMSNFITLTKAGEFMWEDIQDELKSCIIKYLEADKPLLLAHEDDVNNTIVVQEETAVEGKIKRILDEYIQPVVEQDGGAISFHSFKNRTLRVLLQGACSGCPSSTITLKVGIENFLKRMVPEVEVVEAEGI